MSKAIKYEKKTPREHVLARPDTYIGDVEKTKEFMWVYNQESNKIIKKEIIYTPGFLKIFDEILVNARDASVNDKGCDTIKVEFNKEEKYISIYNTGDIPIPVEKHPKHKVLVPSMIFGEMLTSSNYDDSQKRTTGGRNGYGAKLTNIFSKEFYLEVGDTERKKKFKQTWKENMSVIEKAKVTKYSKKENYVYVKFYPDLEKFGLTEFDDYHYQLFYRRTLDIVGTSPKPMKIYFNNKKLNINNFKKYSELYYPDEKLLFDESNERWTVGCIHIPDSEQKVISFVNGISTHRGGTHVNHIVDKVVKALVAEIKKKEKDIKISPILIKDNLVFFINSVIENPAFSSQTKDTLTTKSNKFGSAYKIDDKFIKKIAKSGIVNQVVLLAKFKESSKLNKTNGKKQIKIKGIPKLEDANKAGSKQSNKCSLILTEGDSAKSFAMSGLSIVGRDYYGVFPLKGKLLNVREASVKQRLNNEEINNLKQILGLRLDTEYNDDEDYNNLRYGRIVILTDQDVDGSHIKGLLINFFHYLWPSLIKRKGFITSLSTPIVKAFKGKKEKIFYNLTEYEKWSNKEHKGWKIKYYKGLGTSTSKEAKEYFVDLEDKLINYFCQAAVEGSKKKLNINDDAITLAFDKKRSDDRKKWLMNYDKENILKYEQREITYPEFINSDLIHFSNDDTSRSIPALLDGLKPSQRKILYGAYLRKLDKEEVKVAQLAGFVSDKAAYHHGEASLTGAIIGMAQDFVGSNNINILKPNGQFGCIDPETEVFLWNGKIKLAKNIIVGDILIGDDGTKRIVSKTISGYDNMYKIKNGKMKDYIVNSNHIITLFYSGHKSIYWKESTQSWNVNYFDNDEYKFKSKSIRIANGKTHKNSSKILKMKAYEKMVEFISKVDSNPIFDINIQDYLKLPKYIKNHLKGVVNSTVIQWKKTPLSIDPYILGLWLGDGMSDCHAFSSIDTEIIKYWAIWLDKIGCEVVHCENYNNHESCTYYIRRRGSAIDNDNYAIGDKNHSHEKCKGCLTSKFKLDCCDWYFDKNNNNYECKGYNKDCNFSVNLNPFKKIMKKYDLYKNKHVPNNYIINSKENRLKILAGIIDSDGTLIKQNDNYKYSISQCVKRKHLLESFRIIAGSLGYRSKIYKQKNNMIELSISGNNLEEIPIKVPRKKIKSNKFSRNPYINNIEVECIGKGNFCGWNIDKNRRFLLGDFTITHNTRILGGKDSASPRYIWTQLEDLTPLIFRKVDNPILNQQDDDGMPIEPETYAPIIPMVLINGCEGIGTGFSTKIPPYNPLDVINNLYRLLDGKKVKTIKPFWQGFQGEVKKIDKNNFELRGIYEKKGDNVTITSLPIGVWTSKYKEFLENKLDVESNKKDRKTVNFISYTDNNTDKRVQFDLKFNKGKLSKITNFEKTFNLVKKYSTTNMHLYSVNGSIKKYKDIKEIINEYYCERLKLYQERRLYQLNVLKNELDMIGYKVKFILMIINKELKVNNKKKGIIEGKLEKHKFPRLGINKDFQYLLGMPIYSLTYEKVEELKKQEKEKKAEYKRLEKLTPENIWRNELDELFKAYNKWNDNRNQEFLTVKSKKKNKKSNLKLDI